METTLDFDQAWRAVLNRDPGLDGSLYLAVRSTGIYCKPSCPARRPRRENVTFFATLDAAEAAGYRPCLRCRPREDVSAMQRLVDDVRRLLDASEEPLALADLAASLSVSPGHLQRTFKRATGLSPRQYSAAQRLQRLKQGLRNGDDVAAATYEAGYGSSSRVYEKAGSLLGMTPGAYRRGGLGMAIAYSFLQSSIGPLLVGSTEKGVCFVGFGEPEDALERALRAEYPQAEVRQAPAPDESAQAVLDYLDGRNREAGIPLDLRGSGFQLLVWQALQSIPRGETRSYSQVAESIGMPTGARVVARACATNPVPLAVPCHRVVGKDGSATGYRWGIENKKALLAREREEVDQRTGRS